MSRTTILLSLKKSVACLSRSLKSAKLIGLLDAVGSLVMTVMNSTVMLTWSPPFTLDILLVDPDITGYCLDVVNSTSSETVYSECNITTTQISYPRPQCHDHLFTITPINIVGNGTENTISYSRAVGMVKMAPEIVEVLSSPPNYIFTMVRILLLL